MYEILHVNVDLSFKKPDLRLCPYRKMFLIKLINRFRVAPSTKVNDSAAYLNKFMNIFISFTVETAARKKTYLNSEKRIKQYNHVCQ